MQISQKTKEKVYTEFKKAGYQLRIRPYLLDASKMGVPQRRERVFFIALRNDLANPFMEQIDMFQTAPKLELEFNEKEITFKDIADYGGKPVTNHQLKAWNFREKGDVSISHSKERAGMKVSDFNNAYVYDHKAMPTITGKGSQTQTLFSKPIHPSDNELMKWGSFPLDYNFNCTPGYIIGMSVPPLMTAQIATEVYNQWLSKI